MLKTPFYFGTAWYLLVLQTVSHSTACSREGFNGDMDKLGLGTDSLNQ